jgi:hypothetical protein
MIGTESLHDFIDVLLPDRADATLDALGTTTFSDAGEDVPVSPLDLLILALVRRLLIDHRLERTAVLQLPRAKHRCALMFAICAHLLRMREPGLLQGPVVLAALDVDVTTQLRALTVRNYTRISLGRGNPLGAHRLTRNGSLESLLEATATTTNNALVYFNTRIGAPRFLGGPPLVVIDATSIKAADARQRVVRWAADHDAAATIVVGDLGDGDLLRTVADVGTIPLVLAVTHAESAALTARLGRRDPPASPLSSMSMLWRDQVPSFAAQVVDDQEINKAISAAFKRLAIRPPGPMPAELELSTKLLYNGIRLAARVNDYRTACALAVRPGEGPNPLRRRLVRTDYRGEGPWRAWATTSWGSLKVAVEQIWRGLDQANPKLDALWGALDSADRAGMGRILVRCHSRAAQTATRMSLSSGPRSAAQEALWKRIADRVEISTFAARHPAEAADVQILTGTPPPGLFSVIVGAEASRTVLLAYDVEDALVRHHADRWRASIDRWRTASCHSIGAAAPTPLASIVAQPRVEPSATTLAGLRLPGLSLIEILDRASEAVDGPQRESDESRSGGGAARSCVPVTLDDGRTWWVPNEEDRGISGATPVLVHTAGGHRHIPVRDLHAGDRVVVPAGDGTDSVHARLVAAIHGTDDVASLDAILGQFRAAARSVLAAHATIRAACTAVRNAGGLAADQLPKWAVGTTIAPDEPGDVAAVFQAAHLPAPDLGLLYQVAGTVRTLHRTLGRFVAAASAGRGDDAVAGLRNLLGGAADELLDEFEVATVAEVGAARPVSTSLSGRIR